MGAVLQAVRLVGRVGSFVCLVVLGGVRLLRCAGTLLVRTVARLRVVHVPPVRLLLLLLLLVHHGGVLDGLEEVLLVNVEAGSGELLRLGGHELLVVLLLVHALPLRVRRRRRRRTLLLRHHRLVVRLPRLVHLEPQLEHLALAPAQLRARCLVHFLLARCAILRAIGGGGGGGGGSAGRLRGGRVSAGGRLRLRAICLGRLYCLWRHCCNQPLAVPLLGELFPLKSAKLRRQELFQASSRSSIGILLPGQAGLLSSPKLFIFQALRSCTLGHTSL
mmetsp:Transcript_9480/g.19623  ORF Transcript_9480/g.19623 Transcript_9480/m.19623 type:complete len:276 (+) Transcript_9480:667-1494(+)